MSKLALENLAKFFGHCAFLAVVGLSIVGGWLFLAGHSPSESNPPPVQVQSVQPKQVIPVESVNQPEIVFTDSSPRKRIISSQQFPSANGVVYTSSSRVVINGKVVVIQDDNEQMISVGGVEMHQTRNGQVITVGNITIIQNGNGQTINIGN